MVVRKKKRLKSTVLEEPLTDGDSQSSVSDADYAQAEVLIQEASGNEDLFRGRLYTVLVLNYKAFNYWLEGLNVRCFVCTDWSKTLCELRHYLFYQFSAGGKVFVFGSNFNGQLGLGVEVSQSILPTRVINLAGHVIRDVACGESHTAFITGGRPFLYTKLFPNHSYINKLIL
jgi:hypothetical protein